MLLETVSGKLIDPQHPDEDLIDIHDIAWSLSRISRFSGHTVTAVPYSVAQHCVFVADMMEANNQGNLTCLFGLLHDGAEFAIGDIPSPVKHIPELKPIIDKIESNILKCIFNKCVGRDVSELEWTVVKKYDKRAQMIEGWAFMASRGVNWVGRENHSISLLDLQTFPEPLPSVKAYEKFIQKYNDLMSRRSK